MEFDWGGLAKLRSRWIRKFQSGGRARPLGPSATLRLLGELRSESILHPERPSAREYQAIFDGLGFALAGSGALFMAQAHLWGGWMPLSRFFPDTARAVLDRKSRPFLALAATEPGSGSDFFGMESSAREIRGRWRVSGSKIFVTNGPVAELYLVFARTAGSRAPGSLGCFLLRKGAPGLRRTQMPPRLGLDDAAACGLRLSSAPASEALPGRGAEVFQYAMAWERSLILSSAPGALDRLAGSLREASRNKVRSGRPLSAWESFTRRLDAVHSMANEIRALIARAAAALDEEKCGIALAAATKLQASRKYEEASRILLQLGGKEAFFLGSPWERNFRDSLASSLYSGPNDQLERIVEAMQ